MLLSRSETLHSKSGSDYFHQMLERPIDRKMGFVRTWLYVQFVVLLFTIDPSAGKSVVVNLEHGPRLKGSTMTSTKGKTFYAFRGIPYAEPPVGELRFKAPVPKRTRPEDLFDATKDGPICVQNDLVFKRGVFGEEDCLRLNVYTAKLPGFDHQEVHDKVAVMVYIHGGGFMEGDGTSSSYGPEHLLDTGIVLVTINYRLGLFGFLSTGDEASPGNYGLMDQTLALQWVRDNIEAFGGDTGRVTIFGQSAGGASVGHHILSPLSKGLFHGAIMMSGSPTCSWAVKTNPLYWSQRLAKDAGCSTNDNQELIECLRKISAHELAKYPASYMNTYFPLPFTPTVDGHFLPDHPLNLLQSPDKLNFVPVVSGINEKEGSLILGVMLKNKPKPVIASEEFVTYMISSVLSSQYPSEPGVTEMIKKAYFGSGDFSNEDEVEKTLIDAFSEGFFDSCHYKMISDLTKAGLRTYAYNYEYNTSFEYLGAYGVKKEWGVTHFDELPMLFTTPLKVDFNEEDKEMRKTMLRLWSNFAKYGTPVPLKERTILLKWPRIEDGNIPVYYINEISQVKTVDLDNNVKYHLWAEDLRKDVKRHTRKDEL